VKKATKRSTKALPQHRASTALIPEGVESVGAVMIKGYPGSYRLRTLLRVGGKGYWLDARVTGNIAIGG
jgi:hypothetical protein